MCECDPLHPGNVFRLGHQKEAALCTFSVTPGESARVSRGSGSYLMSLWVYATAGEQMDSCMCL